MASDNKLIFAADPAPSVYQESLPPWKVLLVDDEAAVHEVTKTIFSEYKILDRDIECISAYSAAEAKFRLTEHDDIAVAFVDVVMEEDDSGLQLVRSIREELNNHLLRIVLRTGQPGQAPEKEVFVNYDINDYRTKTELTEERLFTTLLGSIRSYCQIQELIEANRKAEEAHIARSNFLANMSHELRTPLNGITGIGQLVLMQTEDESTAHELRMMLQSSWALNSILDNILNLVSIEKKILLLRNHSFSLPELLEEQQKLFSASLLVKKLHYYLDLDPEIPHQLIGDSERLKQIITNLLSNAIKFTDAGQIGLSLKVVESKGNQIVLNIQVSDTGVGIKPEVLPYIFDPFRQGDESSTKTFMGVGLGLTLVKQLIEMMGGNIEVQSTMGQGSLFSFHLPFERDESASL